MSFPVLRYNSVVLSVLNNNHYYYGFFRRGFLCVLCFSRSLRSSNEKAHSEKGRKQARNC
uniref:Uncharacterized protein n=1 Tax=Anguilla anguilla TaxID=7936 RepID=A0A0E9VB03_ANGAN